MGATLTRHEALAILRDGHERLEDLFGRLSDEQFVRPASIGGGDWSAKDLMGHIALWEEIALVTLDGWLRGKKPPIEETFTDGDTDALNAWNQERKQSLSPERIRQDSAETRRRLVAAIEDMTDETWSSPRPFEDDRTQEDLRSELGGVLGAPDRPFGHAFAHLPDLEAYVTR